jgi:hypothetical protein
MITATSFGLLLWLTMTGAGSGGIDIVSLIPPREYFKAREIEPSIEKLVELAGASPTSGKTQIAQLLALRLLATEAESLKKSPILAKTRELLQEIAHGRRAKDPTGFAPVYAKRALAALEGGKEEAPNVPAGRKVQLGFRAALISLPDWISVAQSRAISQFPTRRPTLPRCPRKSRTNCSR